MIDAEREEDQELYDKLFEIRERKFNNLLRIEADLVYYGHFTLSDVRTMKVIERRYHINEINRRLEEIQKAKNQK